MQVDALGRSGGACWAMDATANGMCGRGGLNRVEGGAAERGCGVGLTLLARVRYGYGQGGEVLGEALVGAAGRLRDGGFETGPCGWLEEAFVDGDGVAVDFEGLLLGGGVAVDFEGLLHGGGVGVVVGQGCGGIVFIGEDALKRGGR
jgi:hypothetical protein